jgi:hypothetical protein
LLFVKDGMFSSISVSSKTVQKSLMAVSNRHLGNEVPELPEAWGKISQNTRFGSYGDEAKDKFPVNVIPDSLRVSVRLAFKDCRFDPMYALIILYQVTLLGSQTWVSLSVRFRKLTVRAERPGLAGVG